ncbi:NAD(P)H-hydrate dehydratase [Aliikangiella coralliicola]|uniref:Bifunctional NAD(P)H-hydrate repair enzyme n=1 Tax=Aliikangiella coralliicola TaxID=2592383 RepID=A0A545UBX5_9GAMM|nr:NAD(P)H-hydrate dehydratase [Aliikangiella coralliicola]TQV86966.1 NAD(P)H-hydrate dehydratase [Aliikangiella coralliicola]
MKRHGLDTGVALYTSSQVRDIEADFGQEEGTYALMEAAGSAVYQELKIRWPHARRILILSGKGNNGGDGYVVARLAAEERKKVTLCNFCPRERLKGDALTAFKKLPRSGLQYSLWEQIEVGEFDLIIDALLGTGIKGPVRAPFDEVIRLVNLSSVPVLSVDVPSGLEADTGNVFNLAIQADYTVTFIGHKRGLYTGDSANYRGDVRLFNLNIPTQFYQKHQFNVFAENWRSLKYKLKPRDPVSHKGNYGHCKIIGGANGMLGAAVLASGAAAKSGSGLTSAWLQNGSVGLVSRQPEIMALDVAKEDISINLEAINSVNSLVVGPGLGRGDWAQTWMQKVSESDKLKSCAKVYDADALNWLAENPNFDGRRVLTPHPGEAGRLLGISSLAVNQDRFTSSHAIAQKYGGICVLKGSGTVVSDANGLQVVCPVGNPGMASGGMGDILAGIIGGLLAQGYSLMDAALLGVCIHGEAADRVAGIKNQHRGMLASELLQHLPDLLNPLQNSD